MIVPAAAADLALDIHIGQEVHLDAALAFSLARFAASARNVKRKTARLVTAFARLGQHGVEIANLGKHPRIGGRIRARRASDGGLVDANHFVDQFRPGDGFMCTGFFAGTVELFCQRAVQDVIHESRFPRTGDAGNHGHYAERKYHVEILQVILACSEDRNRLTIGTAAFGQHGDALPSGHVGARQRIG